MRHISISICDDDETVHRAVGAIIQRTYGNRYCGLEILHYHNASSLLQEAERQQIVLMDISMQGIDGIEAAARLHDIKPQCIVIMLTGRSDRVKDAFKVHATRFVTKPIELEELSEALDSAIGSLKEYEDLIFQMNGKNFCINPRNLIMLEADRNNVILYLHGRSISLRSTMKKMEEALDSALFLRVHKSYIINMGYVEGVEGRELILTDGLRAAVSTRYIRDVVARLHTFELGDDQR